jgi:hypothetical protein
MLISRYLRLPAILWSLAQLLRASMSACLSEWICFKMIEKNRTTRNKLSTINLKLNEAVKL